MTTRRQAAVARALNELAPMMPLDDARAIKALTGRPHMRSLEARNAVWLATIAHIRHVHTDYDALMEDGYDRDAARFFVLDATNDVLRRWRATRLLEADEAVGEVR